MNLGQVPLQLNNQNSFTFDEFVDNHEVVSALSQYQQLPQFTYLWGEKYSGKTHLFSALETVFVSAGINYLILDSDMIKDTQVISNIPADLTFLLINDVNKIMSDSVGELALFNLFNKCLGNQCKLIISSDVSPRSEQWELPDLKSRLNSGLVLMLEVLKGNKALQCIERQFFLHGMPLDQAVVHYLKTTQNTSFSNLYPLFTQLSVQTLKLKKKVTVPLIKKAIQDIKDSVQ